MSVRVRIPTALRPYTGGRAEVEVDGTTVEAVLRAVDAAHPGFAAMAFEAGGNLRRFLTVFIGDEDVRYLRGLDTPVPDGSEMVIIPAAAGG
jgi:molybdopterin converting factor small subunit